MNYLLFLLLVSGFVYSLVVMILVRALGKIRSGSSDEKPFVSVVIAARNESSIVTRCITALMAQDYKPDLFEVIIVDDRSEDVTYEVLLHFQSIWDNLKVIRIDTVPHGLSPKKHALSRAIELACGEIILQTDADCIVPETWISGMVSRFEENIYMVAGVAPYLSGSGALNSFVRHEYLWNVALSGGSIVLGHGNHASARNLGFRRQVFEHIGGYSSMDRVMSGDDTLLLHRIQKLHTRGVVTMPDRSTHTYTKAPEDIGSFFHQRVRHMSTGKYFDPVLLGIGCFVYGYHALTIVLFFLSLVSFQAFAGFICSFVWKNAVDGIVAWRIKTVFGLDVEWRRFILNEFLMVVYMTLLPAAGLFFPVKWKENQLKKN